MALIWKTWRNRSLVCFLFFVAIPAMSETSQPIGTFQVVYNGGADHSNPNSSLTISGSLGITGSDNLFQYLDNFQINLHNTPFPGKDSDNGLRYQVSLHFADGTIYTFPLLGVGDLVITQENLSSLGKGGQSFSLVVDSYYEYIGGLGYLFNNHPTDLVLNESLAEVAAAPWSHPDNVYAAFSIENQWNMNVLLNDMSTIIQTPNSPYIPQPPNLGRTLDPIIQNTPLSSFNDHTVLANGYHYSLLSFGNDNGAAKLHGDHLVYNFMYAAPFSISAGGDTSDAWHTSSSNVWRPLLGNPISGIASASYEIGYSAVPIANPSATNLGTIIQASTPLVSGASIDLPGANPSGGYYYLYVTATDGAGVTSTVVSTPFKYDPTPPQIGVVFTSFPGDGSLLVNWTAASAGVSDLSPLPYSLSYTVGGQMFTPVSATGSLSASIPLAGLYGQSVELTLTAVNNAGVPSATSVPVTVPPRLSVRAGYAGSDGQSMEVDVGFPGVSPQQLKAGFQSLSLNRTVTAGTAALPLVTIDPTAIVLKADGSLDTGAPANADWKTDASGSIEYIDRVPVASGAGHKTWSYALAATPSIEPLAPQTVVLANNPGHVSLLIEDMSGSVYSPGSSAFHVYADGRVQIVLQGTDPDQDHWDYRIGRVAQTEPMTAFTPLSGAAPLGYDGTAAGTSTAPLTVTLKKGINNLAVFWEEGDDAGAEYSAVASVDLEPEPGPAGSYMITVADHYQDPPDSNATGILTSPGNDLTFSVDTTGLDASAVPGIMWNWNDGTGTSAGPSAHHAYGQSPDQTSDQTVYTLSLTIPGVVAPVNLNVTVQDTQEGALLVPETWRGPHTVTGVVTVPAGLSLTVAPGTPVRFQGGLGSGFDQGLDVQGTFSAGDGATFAPAAGQTANWGTVLVEGTASLGDGDVQGAAQGVSVTSNGSLQLTGTRLHDNRIGLHVTGDGAHSPPVKVTDATITDNQVYGVKEDAGGRPRLSGTTVAGNFRNYYSFDQGLLTIDQINGLNTQAAAQNTGDTNEGTDQ